MKSNKGFTLIELLAVIVILAIIALIATPIILGVIETARKGSAKNSALGYIDALEKQIAIDMLSDSPEIGANVVSTELDVPVTGLKVKGAEPEGGTIVIDEKGSVDTGTCLTIKLSNINYKVEYDGTKVTAVTPKESCTAGA